MKKTAFFTIFILLLISKIFAHEPIISHLTKERLQSSTWSFYNDGGYLGDIKFNSPNLIGIYVHENEKYWDFDGSFLKVYSKN